MSLPTASSNAAIGPTSISGSVAVQTDLPAFVERRETPSFDDHRRGERRQFGSSHMGLSEDGRELAFAIDQYKVENHRRYLTCDEMLKVLGSLGYAKN